MHNGEDTAYYLAKGARVVAIEANPTLCEGVIQKFSLPISENRLTVLNLAVSEIDGEVEFFVNDKNTLLSSITATQNEFRRSIRIEARRLSGLFREYGQPDFVKIDIEGIDHKIVRDLRVSGCIPSQFSVEAHSFDVVNEILKTDHSKFRMVHGGQVARRFRSHSIKTMSGRAPFSFPNHSSGPFGEDLPDPWMNAEAMVSNWLLRRSLHGPGWYDIHAMK
jgi:FkbM family methyltransferase